MDLLIIGNPRDQLAITLLSLAHQRGVHARHLEVVDASHLFTIHVKDGGTTVEPRVPMLLRPMWAESQPYGDAFFLFGEAVGAIWAAAALSTAVVINRPASLGFVGRWTPSAALTELRGGFEAPVEVFSSLPKPLLHDHDHWVLHDVVTFDTTMWPTRPLGEGPYRIRAGSQLDEYEFVVVIGRRAWRTTTVDLEHLDLENKSIEITAHLKLSFASFVWAIRPDLGAARLVRIEPYPPMDHAHYVWDHLGPALLEDLLA